MTLKFRRGSTKGGKRVKPRRIYLAEPHDYFGINYFLKMQEKQRQMAQQGYPHHIDNCLHDSCKRVNGIVPSKCWRAYDLHNKPRGLYSDEDKKLAAAAESNLYHNRTAISVPLREVWANKVRGIFDPQNHHHRSLNSTNNCGGRIQPIEIEPLVTTSSESSTTSGSEKGSLSCVSTATSMDGSTFSVNNKQVHFAPNTVFWERGDKPRLRTSVEDKKELKERLKAEKEERLRPRPLLPFLESGLSYCDEEEFYHLKNTEAHKNPEAVHHHHCHHHHHCRRHRHHHHLGDGKGLHCWRILVKVLKFTFCCSAPRRDSRIFPHTNSHNKSFSSPEDHLHPSF